MLDAKVISITDAIDKDIHYITKPPERATQKLQPGSRYRNQKLVSRGEKAHFMVSLCAFDTTKNTKSRKKV